MDEHPVKVCMKIQRWYMSFMYKRKMVLFINTNINIANKHKYISKYLKINVFKYM
jgi:hypothetical protein